MSSPSLTSTATLTSRTSSPDTLPLNVATPGWTTHPLPVQAEPWFPRHTPSPSSTSFPAPSPLAISSPPPTIEIPPILSVDVPVHCHRLCLFLTPTEHATLITTITDPHLAVPFNHYFNNGCPFEALYKAYLQVERLGVIVNSPFTTQNAIAPMVKHITRDV